MSGNRKALTRKIFCLIGIGLAALSGCNAPNISSTNNVTDDEEAVPGQEEAALNREEEVTLYYGCDEISCIDQNTVDAINQYLRDQGCMYKIECVSLYNADEYASTQGYVKTVEDYIDAGNPLDLCYLSVMYDGAWISSFDLLRQDGYIECLSEYLENEDELTAAMPDKKWASLSVDGNIYGINGYVYNTQAGVTYVISKEMMDKYDLSEEDLNKPLSELKDIFLQVQREEEKNNADFSCINYVLNTDDYCYFSKLYPVDGYLAGICLDENESDNPLIYKLDDEEYISLLREMFDLYSENELKVTTDYRVYYENSFVNVYVEGLFPGQNIAQMGGYQSVDEGRSITSDDLLMLYPYDTDLRINDYTSANVIMSRSAHKDEAFDFLKRMYSDEELSNLVQYGAGYTIYDGHIYGVDQEQQLIATGVAASWIRGNGFIGAPCYYEAEDKEEKYFEIYNKCGYVSEWSGFKFDRTGYEQQITATNDVMVKLLGLFSGNVTDFDGYINELRSEFVEAGGESLYEAVSRQFEEYINN